MKKTITACLLILPMVLFAAACSEHRTADPGGVQAVTADFDETLNMDEMLRGMTAPTAADLSAAAPVPSEAEAAAETEFSVSATTDDGGYYVLNTNTHRFHLPNCESVDEMAEKNKTIFYGSREEAVDSGYSPCQKCRP